MLLGRTVQTLAKENNLITSSRPSNLMGRKEFGNSTDRAKDLGTLRSGNSRSFSGDVGGKDLDFFKFKFDQSNKFSAKLENDSNGNQPIAITVLNKRGRAVTGSNGKPLFANIEAGQTFDLSESQLGSGTYYLRVQSAEGRNEDYRLKFGVGSAASGGSSGGSLNNARDLGSLSIGQSQSGGGSVGSNDTDVYKFGIGGTSRMVFQLANNSFNDPIALTVLDSSGNTIRKNNGSFLFLNVNNGNTDSLIAPTLRSGTYFLRFTSQTGTNDPYSFRVTRSAATSPL